MKVRFNCNSGANIHGNWSEVLDVEKDLRVTPEEWEAMTEGDRLEIVELWAWNKLEIYCRLEIYWESVSEG